MTHVFLHNYTGRNLKVISLYDIIQSIRTTDAGQPLDKGEPGHLSHSLGLKGCTHRPVMAFDE